MSSSKTKVLLISFMTLWRNMVAYKRPIGNWRNRIVPPLQHPQAEKEGVVGVVSHLHLLEIEVPLPLHLAAQVLLLPHLVREVQLPRHHHLLLLLVSSYTVTAVIWDPLERDTIDLRVSLITALLFCYAGGPVAPPPPPVASGGGGGRSGPPPPPSREKPAAPPPPVSDERGNLLASIRAGKQLKKVATVDESSRGPSPPASIGGMAGALARALQQRNNVIQQSGKSILIQGV